MDTASVSSQETDPDPTQESVSLSVNVLAAADLSMSLTANSGTILVDGGLYLSHDRAERRA